MRNSKSFLRKSLLPRLAFRRRSLNRRASSPPQLHQISDPIYQRTIGRARPRQLSPFVASNLSPNALVP